MSKINILSSKVYNRIAAGEVIERPASVVKELVENSIDAKATHINIDLIDSGVKEIKVSDDGIGMDKEDALLCFERHATSKLKKEYDLFHINSLGFRGEALPSIASVSKLTLRTCDGKTSTEVEIDGGKVINVGSCDLDKGTVIKVENLQDAENAIKEIGIKSYKVFPNGDVSIYDEVDIGETVSLLNKKKVKILSIRSVDESVEDYYLRLIKKGAN